MRSKFYVLSGLFCLTVLAASITAQETEQSILNRFLQKTEVEQVKHSSWFSASFTLNRINRNNDYNSFATYESTHLRGGSLSWLDMGKSLGVDFGYPVLSKLTLTAGAEYWLNLGQTINGAITYTPTNSTIQNPSSQIRVMGINLGAQYYLLNPPTTADLLTKPSLRIGGNIGFYQANWDLWPEYRSLNLATSTPDGPNITFKGSAPALIFSLGTDYPLKSSGWALCADLNYLYLNFRNVAWYNRSDQPVVATYAGTTDSRVNLALSGLRGKIEIKKFFRW